jgi:prophage antirepressor-like protein
MSLDKTFFLDIFNQIFKINDIEIMMIFDVKGKVWFGLRDIIKVLNYGNIEKAITKIKISKINKKIYGNIEPHPGGGGSLTTIKPHKIFINETGLYEVLLKSTKPLAEIFTQKLLIEIMPQIRQKGEYIIKGSEKKELDKINKKLDNYKQELTYYYDKYNFESSKNGYFYINEDSIIKNGKKIICYSPEGTYTFL